ncbi:WXG100 family type VII secretion target [Kineosporia babensis]|uniref:Uncharacterized protein n=1 Tax=Kineosporia babensis TaxID=499548 RepID=A0A9X1SS54_9ACTN|nr:hypothetical protein [Kineosporia babensis]MCD5310302.1 hypothetical protein [Kineosporia babensis]
MTQRSYDPATTQNMVQAFDTTMTMCQSIAANTDEITGNLTVHYTGEAAVRYQNSMAEWLTGFHRVRNGLNLLSESMQGYRRIATATEENNQATATGWGQYGQGGPPPVSAAHVRDENAVPATPTQIFKKSVRPEEPLAPTRRSLPKLPDAETVTPTRQNLGRLPDEETLTPTRRSLPQGYEEGSPLLLQRGYTVQQPLLEPVQAATPRHLVEGMELEPTIPATPANVVEGQPLEPAQSIFFRPQEAGELPDQSEFTPLQPTQIWLPDEESTAQ